MKLLIIIPAYNESSVIASVIQSIKQSQPQADILVVDDGSVDNTHVIAQNSGAIVVRHIVNRGLGGAIGTGISFARQHQYDFAVTIDADGQHDPQDIESVLAPLLADQADVVVGSRMVHQKEHMPFDRRILNILANLITLLFFGARTTDSQSGFRAFNRRVLESLQVRTDRMEVSSEIFSEINRLKLRYAEVPIRVIYTDYSRSKGQSNANMWQVGYKLMLRLFR